ncbi:MAG: NifB/NifX family molybdenum-iron cluster-binding protein [Pseudomonadota bacterium]
MKIAVTSQNRKTVTGHAGKCRKFWVYDVDHAEARSRNLLELGLDQTFHASHGEGAHPLDGINVLITAGLGTGLQQRLKRKGILAVATPETDPDRAVAAWLNGTLAEVAPEDHSHGHPHGHDHSHH